VSIVRSTDPLLESDQRRWGQIHFCSGPVHSYDAFPYYMRDDYRWHVEELTHAVLNIQDHMTYLEQHVSTWPPRRALVFIRSQGMQRQQDEDDVYSRGQHEQI
jgi:hypothetical protein